jgi:ubiquinone/menaquinone biosynthesis C-methylase UbiE
MAYLAAVTDQCVGLQHRLLQTHRLGKDYVHVYALLQLLNPPQGAVILDAGCGVGGVADLMHSFRPDLQFLMVNVSARQLDYCPKEAGVPVQGSCHNLPVKTAACDAAILLCAMCNMDIPVALGEIARVLKPGAPLLVADVARISGDNEQCLKLLYMHAFPLEQINAWAADAGFRLDYYKQPLSDTTVFESLFEDKQLFHDIFRHLRYTIWRFVK